MKIKYEELKSRLAKGIIDPLYLFTGEDMYYLEEAIHSIQDRFLSKEEQQANLHTMYVDDLDIDVLWSLGQTIPMVGKNRLIIIKQLEKMKTDSTQTQRFLSLVQKKHQDLSIILCAEKIDQRTKLGKTLEERATSIHFYKLFENEVPQWIIQEVKRNGKRIPPRLAHLLAHLLGNDLLRIQNELNKIYLYMGNIEQINEEHLEIVSGEARMFSVFDLVKYVGERKLAPSLKILTKLMNEGTYPLVLLSMLVRQFRSLYLTKCLIEEGREPELAKLVGLPPLFLRQLKDQAKLFTRDQLQGLLTKFLAIDLQLKSSSCDHCLILESALFEVCQSL